MAVNADDLVRVLLSGCSALSPAFPLAPLLMAHGGETRTEKHVLVVEDDADTAAMLAEALRTGHYRVSVASTAEAALQTLTFNPTSNRIDVVLLDLGLPGMNGVEFVAALMMQGEVPPPVVVISAWTPNSLGVAADFIHPAAVLRKPFSLERLMAAIDATLRSADQ